jgi:NAD(P)-dependent dehydrogenase (short-subunit alcohol dehydrogenase family)
MRDAAAKCAVIIGSASGLGYGLALGAAERGMDVLLADKDAEGAERAAEEVRARGVRAVAVQTDVSDPRSVERLAETAYDQFGSVQLLVHNAGVYRNGPVWETPFEDWRWLSDVNVGGPINAVHFFVPRMLRQEDERRIVITASANGLWSMTNQGAYNATKYALVGLAEALAEDLAPHGIGVSVICPGPMQGRMSANSTPPSMGGASMASVRDRYIPPRLQAMLDTWPMLAPEEAGQLAWQGIERGEFWVLPHAEGLTEIRTRQRGIEEAFKRRASWR